MSKLQKVSLIFSILVCILFSIKILLGFDVLSFIKKDSLFESLYAFLVGISGFLNITILSKKER